MEVEQPAEEAVDEEALLATVRQGLGARLGLREAAEQVGDVLAERADSPARRRLADEVGDQQAEKQLALAGVKWTGVCAHARSASRPFSMSV